MQSKQGIAGGSSIPPAQKPPPKRSLQDLARELRLAQDLLQGNPAYIAKHLRSLIHDPLRAITREFNASKDINERERLHQHRLALVTCHIRADAALLLNGPSSALRAERQAKIDTPLKGVEEKLKTERKSWKGDQAGFDRHFATLITHRAALAAMAEQADQKMQPRTSPLYTVAKKAGTLLGGAWGALRERAISVFTPRNADIALKGVAASALAGALVAGGHSLLSKTFTQQAAPEADPVATIIITPPPAPQIARVESPRPHVQAPPALEKKVQAVAKAESKPDAITKKTRQVAEAEPAAKLRFAPVQATDLRSTLSASIAEWATSNTDKRYRLGGNNSRFMDCSQFVIGGLRAARDRIEGMHGVRLDIHGLQTISAQITKVMANAGGYLSGRNVTRSKIEPGMIIGVDSGKRGWDKGRWNGIDHIAITYQEPTTGDLYVAESTSEKDPVAKKTGVRTMPFSTWLDQASSRGYRMIVADVLSLARDKENGQSVVAKLSNPAAEKEKGPGSYKYAVYKMPATDAHAPSHTQSTGQRTEAFNSYASVTVSWTPPAAQEGRAEIAQQAHTGISQSEREQALIWSRQQMQQDGATAIQQQPQL